MKPEIAAIDFQQVTTLSDETAFYEMSPAPRIYRYVLLGILTLSAFVGGALYWSLLSKLDGAVVAPASFVVEGNRKGVEHIDGGIVRAVLVKDGASVEKGQTLVRLDSSEIDIDLKVLGSQIGELSVRRARLVSQINGVDRFDETAVLSQIDESLDRQHWFAAFLTQKQFFQTEARARRSELHISEQQVESLSDQIAGLQEQRMSGQKQLEITQDQLDGLQTLFAKGLVTAPRLNALRVEIERLKGTDAALRTQMAQAQNQISELKLAQARQQKLRDEGIAAELAAVEAQISLVLPQYLGVAERRKRVDIIAPSSGRVVNLDVSTQGEVIRSGERILDIVPTDQQLIVEARISPTDIDKLWVGQATRVRLSAFADTEVPEAQGQVIDISADALEDPRTGEPFYLARVMLDPEQPDAVANLELLPGMPADVFVATGERTAFAYLAQPINERLVRAFIE